MDNAHGLSRFSDTPPRQGRLADKWRSDPGCVTTLMLRNVPLMYTQQTLLTEFGSAIGSDAEFNYFYLPWDKLNKCNVGYAFVNFCESESAERCMQIFNDHQFHHCKTKHCRVLPAHIQGLEQNLLHMMGRAVADSHSHYPIIVWKGQHVKLGKVIAALHTMTTSEPAAEATATSTSAPSSSCGPAARSPGPGGRDGDGVSVAAPARAPLSADAHRGAKSKGRKPPEQEILEEMHSLRSVLQQHLLRGGASAGDATWDSSATEHVTWDSSATEHAEVYDTQFCDDASPQGYWASCSAAPPSWNVPAPPSMLSSNRSPPTSSLLWDGAVNEVCAMDGHVPTLPCFSQPPGLENAPHAAAEVSSTFCRAAVITLRSPDEDVLRKFFARYG